MAGRRWAVMPAASAFGGGRAAPPMSRRESGHASTWRPAARRRRRDLARPRVPARPACLALRGLVRRC